MTTMTNAACERFLDDLADVIAGDEAARARHVDHVEECDRCRDAAHEARVIARAMEDAGADFRMPADLSERVMAMIDEPRVEKRTEQTGEQATGNRRQAMVAAPVVRTRRPWGQYAALGMAAAAAVVGGVVGVKMLGGGGGEKSAEGAKTWAGEGRVLAVDRASDDGRNGLIMISEGREVAIGVDGVIPVSARLRTDERTRARVELPDGSEVALDHRTEIEIDGAQRRVRLIGGELVAEVIHLDSAPAAVFATANGDVKVLGTRFGLSAAADFTSVKVSRGRVTLAGMEVRAGEEGSVRAGEQVRVVPVLDLGQSLAWSEGVGEGPEVEGSLSGLGQLRAFRPGEKRDRDWKLALDKHTITVRIAGNVARTEIEETFRNDSDKVLEGVYSFPLPPDASIDRLALDVDGTFLDGAFEDKQRAAKIWAGVIDKATPKKIQQTQEIVWVPGPWRDPALLEWKRGGRFELRIFPIPAHGGRTIKIGYTQVLRPQGDSRRYVYPLPHAVNTSTAVGKFSVDVRVAGADPKVQPRPFGYQLQAVADGDATRMTLAEDKFQPRGNLIVEYRLPKADAELRAWTFRGDVAAAPGELRKLDKKNAPDPKVIELQKQIAADARPAVVLALKPVLPRWTESRPRDLAIVLDSSQSMVGERWTRSTQLVAAMIAEMDGGDRVRVLACDAQCRDAGPALAPPSSALARDTAAWLGKLTPAGSSDLAAALTAAGATFSGDAAGRERWIVYVGDGLASAGHRRTGALVAEAHAIAVRAGAAITAVGIGGDADAAALGAIARAGGGFHVPWTPGQKAAVAARAVLETTYGVSLRDATIELPAGLADAAPTVLPTLRAGEEVLIAARFTGEVAGDVVLKGTVGGKPFINRYPIKLAASTAAGNAFVPRQWAALTIGELELAGRGEDRARIVALSKAYGVLSRETSLLVLESEEMFRAFAVDRSQPTVRFTGDEAGEATETEGKIDYHGSGSGAGYGKGASRAEAADPAPAKKPAAPREFDILADGDGPVGGGRFRGRRGGMIAMRKVWYRVGDVGPQSRASDQQYQVIAKYEAALAASPDSRERHRNLVQALTYAGELTRAREVAARWLERDRVDPEALVYLADIAGREGRRDEALRLLSGVVDIQADDKALHGRLATAYERIGAAGPACSHRITLAELSPADADAAGAALRCQRALGRAAGAEATRAAIADDATRMKAETVATTAAPAPVVNGDLVVDASWSGGSDLELTIVTSTGTRLSWMGGRTGVTADGATDTTRERLALRRASKGSYLIEVSRARTGDTTPVTGRVTITLLGRTRTLDFRLDGERTLVGRAGVTMKSRLVPF